MIYLILISTVKCRLWANDAQFYDFNRFENVALFVNMANADLANGQWFTYQYNEIEMHYPSQNGEEPLIAIE